MALLPYRWSIVLQKLEPYGFFILLAFMLTGTLAFVLNPLINGAMAFLQMLFNL